MNFAEIFRLLCAEKSKSPTAVGQELGFAKSAISRWINGTANPSYKATSYKEKAPINTEFIRAFPILTWFTLG